MKNLSKNQSPGQISIGAMALLVGLMILGAAMVSYIVYESKWTVKEQKTTTAFQLAEAATERGYWEISQLSSPTANIPIAGYNFDQEYNDLAGGAYAIQISSDSSSDIIITGIGRDNLKKETREIQSLYENGGGGKNAIVGGGGVDESGTNMHVEWGAIISQSSMTANSSRLHPSLWSSGEIAPFDTSNTPPNCDSPNCWWWHAYDPNLPPMPSLNFNYYESLAQSEGVSPCGGSYYTNGNRSGSCNDLSGNTYYVTGNWTSFDGPVAGNVIVLGDVTTPNGALSGTSINAAMPQNAWAQYCNDWSFYLTTYNDTYAQSHYPSNCPGLSSSYLSSPSITYSISPAVQGLLYVGGDFTGPNGGGNSVLVFGVLMVAGKVHLNSNSHVTIYYDANVGNNLKVTKTSYARVSWKEIQPVWPSGLP